MNLRRTNQSKAASALQNLKLIEKSNYNKGQRTPLSSLPSEIFFQDVQVPVSNKFFSQNVPVGKETKSFLEHYSTFSKYLDDYTTNCPSTKAIWLHIFKDHVQHYLECESIQSSINSAMFDINDLIAYKDAMCMLDSLKTLNKKEKFGAYMEKLVSFIRINKAIVIDADIAQTMRKVNTAKARKMQQVHAAYENDIERKQKINQWPSDNINPRLLRATVLDGIWGYVNGILPRLKSKPSTITYAEKKILSSLLPVVVNLDGKPMRSCNLQGVTCDLAVEWKMLSQRGLLNISESKGSCISPVTWLPSSLGIQKALCLHVDTIRPFLVSADDVTIIVSDEDLFHANTMIRLQDDKFDGLCVLKSVQKVHGRRINKWNIIFEYLAPSGVRTGWITPRLTANILHRAFIASKYNSCLFVDHNGNPMINFGLVLGDITHKFVGIRINELTLRKYIETSASEKETTMTNIALEHTAATASKHYKIVNSRQQVQKFVEKYAISGPAAHETGVTTASPALRVTWSHDLDLWIVKQMHLCSKQGHQVSWKTIHQKGCGDCTWGAHFQSTTPSSLKLHVHNTIVKNISLFAKLKVEAGWVENDKIDDIGTDVIALDASRNSRDDDHTNSEELRKRQWKILGVNHEYESVIKSAMNNEIQKAQILNGTRLSIVEQYKIYERARAEVVIQYGERNRRCDSVKQTQTVRNRSIHTKYRWLESQKQWIKQIKGGEGADWTWEKIQSVGNDMKIWDNSVTSKKIENQWYAIRDLQE